MRLFQLLCSGSIIAALGVPVRAQDASGGYHGERSSEIIVTAPFQRDRHDVLSGVTVLQGEELTQSLRPTVGETIARTPGVSATSFGPNASRPVLRGLQGERVRVLTDGIGSIDASNTSVDHAVVVNPLLAERIEILRGPEALLYGSSAIGGVVNVIDKRIPRSIPHEPIHVDAITTYGSAANERSGGGAIAIPLGQRFVIHADAAISKPMICASAVMCSRARAVPRLWRAVSCRPIPKPRSISRRMRRSRGGCRTAPPKHGRLASVQRS